MFKRLIFYFYIYIYKSDPNNLNSNTKIFYGWVRLSSFFNKVYLN